MVYQGDVESIVSKSGQPLTRMLEIVSGSDALAADYERAQTEVHKAEDSVVFNWQKRRGLAAEKKQYKQQKVEAEKYYKLKREEARTSLPYNTIHDIHHTSHISHHPLNINTHQPSTLSLPHSHFRQMN
jgi:structural maintenance of chromosome 1